jgi:hypothetical protein
MWVLFYAQQQAQQPGQFKEVSQLEAILNSIEDESASVGRIYTEELEQNPDIMREKVDAKIKEILDKYGYQYIITGFTWQNGEVQGMIDMVKKYEEAKDPREPWDFVEPRVYSADECPNCHREGRIEECKNGMHRCGKCQWVVELNAPCQEQY